MRGDSRSAVLLVGALPLDRDVPSPAIRDADRRDTGIHGRVCRSALDPAGIDIDGLLDDRNGHFVGKGVERAA